MVEGADEWNGCGQEGRHQNDLFYTDDRMVASLDPRWLQGVFSTLLGLLNRMGLKTNVSKTVGMVFRPCQAAGTQSEAAYRRRIMGVGPSYQERQQVFDTVHGVRVGDGAQVADGQHADA